MDFYNFRGVSVYIIICGIFGILLVNVLNLFRQIFHNKKYSGERAKRWYAEQNPPQGILITLSDFATMLFWAELFLYIFIKVFLLELPLLLFELDSIAHILGNFLLATGFLLQVWSLESRGRFATHWEMPENQKLVTSGPYRFVRHPFYLGYFFLFIGFFLVWPNFLSIIPIFAIPGYFRVIKEEEKLLVKRFGKLYLSYKENVGGLFPKLRKTRKTNESA